MPSYTIDAQPMAPHYQYTM